MARDCIQINKKTFDTFRIHQKHLVYVNGRGDKIPKRQQEKPTEPKSLRSAFIRIMGTNETEKGTETYTRPHLITCLETWKRDAPNTLAYWSLSPTHHDPQDHWHILLEFNNPVPFERVKSVFPYGKIEKPRNKKAAMQYLIHFNNPEKEQFIASWDAITTNRESLDEFKTVTKSQQEIDLYRIIERIGKGEIREFNQYETIANHIWAQYKTRIENALTHYRERVYMDKNRDIKVVFFQGETGTGKTSYAKDFCEKARYSYSISSSSNDPLQDYKGEDILILDDFRDENFKSIADMLKFLDNHTKSTARSRYHNKAFIGEAIFITSNKPLKHWYALENEDERKALFRRIKEVYHFTPERVYQYVYDPVNKDQFPYRLYASAPNHMHMTEKQLADIGIKLFETLGIETYGTLDKFQEKK